MSVRIGSATTGYIGRQRVQADQATDSSVQKTYVSARLAEAKALYAKGCKGANFTVKSTPAPPTAPTASTPCSTTAHRPSPNG